MPGGLGPRFVLEAGFLIALAAVAAYARLSAVEIIAVMAGGWLLTALFEAIAATRERVYARTRWERRVEEEPPATKPEPAAAEPEPRRRRSWLRRAAEPESEAKAAPEAPAQATVPAGEGATAQPPAAAAPVARARPSPEAPARPTAPVERQPAEEAPAAADPAAEAEARLDAPAPRSAPAVEPVRRVQAEAPAGASSSSDDEATGEFEQPAQGPRRWLRRRQAEPPPEPEILLEPARPSARHVRLIRGRPKGGAEAASPAEDENEERKGADTAP